MSASRVSAIVSTSWLGEHLSKANIRVLDGSWHLPNQKRDPRQEYLQAHIPGSQFFDIDGCSTPSDLSHMLPQSEQFENYVGKELGIGNDSHVVIYDNNEMFGMLSAQRVWWTFRIFGHRQVSVLDGGLPKWLKENRPVTKDVDAVVPQTFKAHFQANLVKSYEDMEQNLENKKYQMVDARPSGRFEGKAPEPRADVKPGCIRGSQNIPFIDCIDPESKTFLQADQLKQRFQKAGVDLEKPIIATCGSGISACMLALAAYQCGVEDVAVYDGSWMEWYHRAPANTKLNVPDN